MMDLILTRRVFLPNCTLGTLELVPSGKFLKNVYLCDTLEPTYRDLSKEAKVRGKTAIPYGRYRIKFAYSQKFRKQMPYLLDVPKFIGIMIHSGNTPRDTKGCILVGQNPEGIHTEFVDVWMPRIERSRSIFQNLFSMLEKAEKENEEIYITVTYLCNQK